jgi:homoserine dehydrogenase
LELRVHPTLINATHLLAQVHGAMNAVMVKSDAAGVTLYYGAGAGAEQTASAVIADLVDLCRSLCTEHQHRVPALAFQPSAINALPVVSITEMVTLHYLRLNVTNPAQTVPTILEQLSHLGVRTQRLEVLAHSTIEELSTVLVLTGPTRERVLRDAISNIEALPNVMGGVRTIRMEALN